jgi:hypothetical protein
VLNSIIQLLYASLKGICAHKGNNQILGGWNCLALVFSLVGKILKLVDHVVLCLVSSMF